VCLLLGWELTSLYISWMKSGFQGRRATHRHLFLFIDTRLKCLIGLGDFVKKIFSEKL
jgi:hypothetical protein